MTRRARSRLYMSRKLYLCYTLTEPFRSRSDADLGNIGCLLDLLYLVIALIRAHSTEKRAGIYKLRAERCQRLIICLENGDGQGIELKAYSPGASPRILYNTGQLFQRAHAHHRSRRKLGDHA